MICSHGKVVVVVNHLDHRLVEEKEKAVERAERRGWKLGMEEKEGALEEAAFHVARQEEG